MRRVAVALLLEVPDGVEDLDVAGVIVAGDEYGSATVRRVDVHPDPDALFDDGDH